ncbi:MAG: membrane protein insertase YidC [Kiritimatiellia bacterium]
MNRNDKIIVAVLALLLCLSFWQTKQYQDAQRKYAEEHPEAFAAERTEAAAEQPAALPANSETALSAAPEHEAGENADAAGSVIQPTNVPETTAVLSNDVVQITLTSKGGAIRHAVLTGYKRTQDSSGDDFVEYDFSDDPTLALERFPGFWKQADYTLEKESDTVARLTASVPGGFSLMRTFTLDGYRVSFKDSFVNQSETPLEKPAYNLVVGAMNANGSAATNTPVDFGIDLHMGAGGKWKTLEQNLAQGFDKAAPSFAGLYGGDGGGCSAVRLSPSAPVTAKGSYTANSDWVSVRDRFFVSVLKPEGSRYFTAVETRLSRDMDAPIGSLKLRSAGAAMQVPAETVAPGATSVFEGTLYLGPRKLSELRTLGPDCSDIMHFGTWGLFCRLLLDLLNFIYRFIPNYGWTIIVMTILVRMVLFPLNRKSMNSMRKMSEIQPLMKELQEKYKDDPKKLQQEQMLLFQKYKVNPMSGCLPMLIQLPIFIALFTVLRSCVELRYAGFLWISDLSAPENLFIDTIGFPINILPITMAITMTLQSALTPSTGDASQKKMMTIFMPVMMLLMCYNFPSALGLYWTVSQGLAIFGMYLAKRTKKGGSQGGVFTQKDGSVVIPPPRETRQMRRERERSGEPR